MLKNLKKKNSMIKGALAMSTPRSEQLAEVNKKYNEGIVKAVRQSAKGDAYGTMANQVERVTGIKAAKRAGKSLYEFITRKKSR